MTSELKMVHQKIFNIKEGTMEGQRNQKRPETYGKQFTQLQINPTL